jgi:hypothetical protein
METSTEKNELIPIINELKQKLKADGQILTTNAYHETCGRLDYDKETGIFLYSPYAGDDIFQSDYEMGIEVVLHILQFEDSDSLVLRHSRQNSG